MKEEKTAVKTAGKENEPVIESTTKKKTKEEKPPTKVVIRRLPPSMTEDQFKVQVSPMPDYDYFYFVPADMSLMPNAFSRAYINFTDQNDLFIFTQKFDGYVFVDSKGGEFPAVVEFAPFQRIPKNRPNRKKDSKVGTIEADPIYIAFKERIEAENLENKTAVNTSKQHFFETSALDKKEEVNNTPLLDYIRNKRAERQRIREEKREEKRKKDLERRRAKEEQRRVKKEDDTSVVKNPPSPVTSCPKTKEDNSILLDSLEIKENPHEQDVEEGNEASEKLLPKQTDETDNTNKKEKITKKVREIVEFVSKSINEINKDEGVKSVNTTMLNYIKHEDLEREIMKNFGDERDVKSKLLCTPKVPSPKKFTNLNIPLSGGNYKEPTNSGPSYPIPVLESRGRLQVYVPRTARHEMYSRSNSDIVMRPVRVNPRGRKENEPAVQKFIKECEIIRPVRPIRVNIPVIHSNRRDNAYHQSIRKPSEGRIPVRVNIPLSEDVRSDVRDTVSCRGQLDSKTYSDKLDKVSIMKSVKKEVSVNSDKTNNHNVDLISSSEALKKSLEKVVATIHGNTKVNRLKASIINKPKTFARRGYGDEFQGKGFNTPNFYLPPRAYGCGINSEVSDSKDNKNNSTKNNTNASLQRQCPTRVRNSLPSVPKKSLPPFSKKSSSASSSKSDGDIEKPETVTKVGGSDESLKRMPPQAFIVQQPCATPKKLLATERVLNSSQALNKERSKDKEVKSSFIKKKPDDGKTTTKDKFSTEAKLKEGKRTGKSYLEERQRLAERREEQRKKLSQDQSNGATKSILALDEGGGTAAEEVKPGEDATMPATESKGKETESKKPERVFKREERRNSYKYESKRDRDDDPRRSRRGTERSYQNNKRDDERSEDGGRKKYSDSRRGHDTSQRDRYKDKEKNKGFSQRKNETVRETEKRVISGKESADKPSTSETSLKKDSEMLVEKKTEKSTEKLDCNTDIKENPPKSDKIELGNKSKMFDSTQPIRRKSMDYDQTKSSLSYSKSNSKDKYYEKRRNSIGSNENTVLNVENEKEEFQNKTSGKESPLPITSKENQIKSSEIEIKSAREREIRKEFEDEQREIPKRRNSTGGQEAEKMSSRRNSLGSEDKNKVSDVKEPKVVGEVTLEGEKSKSCHEGQNVRDPRTERRIRNKDRPSLEIYRPGMGRFSKQRFEREKEKGLGSSTEMDSPSPSPSPTPQLKHKSTTPH